MTEAEPIVEQVTSRRRGRSTGAPRCVRKKAHTGWWYHPREVRFRSVSLSRNFRRERKELIQLQFSNLRVSPSTSEMNNRKRGGGNVGYGGIPDRWLQYGPVGKHIERTRFVPFKCPLDVNFFERRSHELSEEDYFTVEMLLAMAENQGKKIGLVIDLTNTKRYYDPNEFTSRGTEYVKINCPGHEVDSREDIVEKFNSLVDSYLQRAPPDTLIGVHCTHGLNRTGYLIGRYMIERMNWNAEEFINMFEHCRGHQIERAAYKEKLKWAQDMRDQRATQATQGSSSS